MTRAVSVTDVPGGTSATDDRALVVKPPLVTLAAIRRLRRNPDGSEQHGGGEHPLAGAVDG